MVAMITNATSTCYLTLLAVLAGFPVFCLFRSILLKKKIDKLTRILMAEFALLFAFSIAIYPYTPRHKMEELKHAFYSDNEQQFVQEMSDLGYDIYAMSLEEKMSDPVVHEKLTVYYNRFICNTVMSMREVIFLPTLQAMNSAISVMHMKIWRMTGMPCITITAISA